ncbi:MAG: hypothetical protein M0P58_07580 [Bacteroidales bacterium]|nr:hypothetical protein [Bacteroidales bacterium]
MALRKGLTYFFLFVFLYSSMGNYMVFELNKYMVQQEMQAFLHVRQSRRRQIILEVTQPIRNPEFRRINDREIRYKGKLYDIIREIKKGNKSVFICIHDAKEELLIAGFLKNLHRKINFALSHNLVTQALPLETDQHSGQDGIRFLFPEKTKPLISVFLTLFAPPPKVS